MCLERVNTNEENLGSQNFVNRKQTEMTTGPQEEPFLIDQELQFKG
jgi:hypothetical protein